MPVASIVKSVKVQRTARVLQLEGFLYANRQVVPVGIEESAVDLAVDLIVDLDLGVANLAGNRAFVLAVDLDSEGLDEAHHGVLLGSGLQRPGQGVTNTTGVVNL